MPAVAEKKKRKYKKLKGQAPNKGISQDTAADKTGPDSKHTRKPPHPCRTRDATHLHTTKDGKTTYRKRKSKKADPTKPKKSMQQNILIRRKASYDGDFKWTKQKVLAARLISTGQHTMNEIAAAVKCSKSTLYFWLTHTKFCDFTNKLAFETGLAIEGERNMHIKKRVRQLNEIIDRNVGEILQPQDGIPVDVSMATLFGHEARMLDMLDKMEKGSDQTIHHTFSGFSPDQKRVNNLKTLVKDMPDDIAKGFKDIMAKRAAEILKRKDDEQAQKEAEENEI